MRLSNRPLPRISFRTIRAKIAAAISVVLGLISLFIFIFFPARLEKQAFKAISAKANSIAEMTAFSISPALFFEDVESIKEVIKSARQNEDLAYMVVLDSSGNMIADFSKDKADQIDFSHARDDDHISPDGAICEVMTPIKIIKDILM